MRELPILFSTSMVQAILDGRKTMTRRVIKPQPPDWCEQFGFTALTPRGCISGRGFSPEGYAEKFIKLPYAVGDILWVRETWNGIRLGTETVYWYKADEPEDAEIGREKWRPSVHMPREAARIFLRVTDVRVQRVQEIGLGECYAEGCDEEHERLPKEWFATLWDSLYVKRGYGWDVNPWVAVYTFERVEG